MPCAYSVCVRVRQPVEVQDNENGICALKDARRILALGYKAISVRRRTSE